MCIRDRFTVLMVVLQLDLGLLVIIGKVIEQQATLVVIHGILMVTDKSQTSTAIRLLQDEQLYD